MSSRGIAAARAFATLAALSLTSSCSLALKTGVHRWSNGDLEDIRGGSTLGVSEIEAGVREWPKHHVDLAFAADFVDSSDGTGFMDLRLTSRYHFRENKRFSPVVGGGVGWFRWDTKEGYEFEGLCDAGGGAVYPCAGVAFDDVTLAQGYYPHFVAGVNMRVSRLVDLVLEDRFDFAKEDGPVDFESNQLVFGVRLLWSRPRERQ